MKDSAIFLWFVMLLVLGSMVIGAAEFVGFKVFAPLYEQVRYDTFKQSQAYNDGMLRELYSFRVQWNKGDMTQKSVIKAAVEQQYGAYDRSRLPLDLQSFVAEVEKF